MVSRAGLSRPGLRNSPPSTCSNSDWPTPGAPLLPLRCEPELMAAGPRGREWVALFLDVDFDCCCASSALPSAMIQRFHKNTYEHAGSLMATNFHKSIPLRSTWPESQPSSLHQKRLTNPRVALWLCAPVNLNMTWIWDCRHSHKSSRSYN